MYLLLSFQPLKSRRVVPGCRRAGDALASHYSELSLTEILRERLPKLALRVI
jgi:hypothetical protein